MQEWEGRDEEGWDEWEGRDGTNLTEYCILKYYKV